MGYRDNPRHLVRHHIKRTKFCSADDNRQMFDEWPTWCQHRRRWAAIWGRSAGSDISSAITAPDAHDLQ